MQSDNSLPQLYKQPGLPSVEVVAQHDLMLPPTSSTSTVKFGLGILGLFLLAVIGWIALVPMGAAIHAQGEVVFQGKRQTVQHLEGGIVKAILVKDGDIVKAGQPLIELEESQVEPMVQMLEQQDAAELAQAARLEAESRGLASIPYPKSLLAQTSNPEIKKIIEHENRLFSARQVSYGSQVQLIRHQMAEIRENIKGLEESLKAKRQEIMLISEQLSATTALQADGYIPRSTVLEIQRQLAEKNGQKNSMAASLASERQRIHELEQRIATIGADRVQGATTELKQSSLRRIDLQERIRPVKDTLDRQIIKAPVAGKVVGLKVTTVGGVIMPRDTLMEIAPLNDELIVEARIRIEDVNQVKVGQGAEITISGLDRRTIPPFMGKITYISADRIMPQPGQGQQAPYFAATIKIDEEYRHKVSEVQVMPGMTAMIAISVKPRTAYSYIFEPLLVSMRKAIHAK